MSRHILDGVSVTGEVVSGPTHGRNNCRQSLLERFSTSRMKFHSHSLAVPRRQEILSSRIRPRPQFIRLRSDQWDSSMCSQIQTAEQTVEETVGGRWNALTKD